MRVICTITFFVQTPGFLHQMFKTKKGLEKTAKE